MLVLLLLLLLLSDGVTVANRKEDEMESDD
jgi:hypothetical protein